MKKQLLIAILLMLGLIQASAVTKIYREYKSEVWSDSLSRFVVKNSKVTFYFEGERVKEVHINFPTGEKSPFSYGSFCYADVCLEKYKTLRSELIEAKKKYEEWSIIAKDNKVTSFSKEIVNAKGRHYMHAYTKDGSGMFSSYYGRVGYDSSRLPLFINFVIDTEGPFLNMAYGNVTLYRKKEIDGYIPSIWSAILTSVAGKDIEEVSIKKFGIYFRSSEEIQSLIDALEGTAALEDLRAKKKEDSKNEELFK